MKKHVAAALAALLLAAPATNLWASAIPQPVYNQEGQVIGQTKALPRPASTYVLASISADVTGDGTADLISLTGRKGNQEDIFASNMTLVVKDGQSDQSLVLDLNMGGYEGKLFAGDFTGDHIAEVLVSSRSGGSGGVLENRIATFLNGQPSLIFAREHNKGASFTGQFLDGWKTAITNTDTGKTLIIDNGQGREDYIRLGIYDETGNRGKAATTPWSYPFSALDPIDPDNDGVYELKGHQRIVGAYNADPIAEIESQWKYENNQWAARQIKVAVNLLNHPVRATSSTAPAHAQ